MANPYFGPEDRTKIRLELDAILDGALSMGPNVEAFERAFAERVGVQFAIAMNSCTSALEAALQAKGVVGREVIVPAETFIATGMAVHLAGGRPIFAEISPKTLCLDLADVARRVTADTAGVILVHMAGLITPDILEFRKFCDDRGLFLLEDAAHSPGARIYGREAGSFGHAACFSFYPTKVITAGEGGMLTTDDSSIAEYVRSYQHRGRDMKSPTELYLWPGRNVRMTEMAALLGRIQYGHLDEYIAARRKIAGIYKQRLAEFGRVKLIVPEMEEASSFWKVPLLLDRSLNRAKITEMMGAAGIAVDWAYQPALHLQPVFKRLYGTKEGTLPITEDILSRHLCLPCHPRMSEEDAIYVSTTLKNVIDESTRTNSQ